MGMGDAGANPKHAADAARCLTDNERFGVSRHRLTLSTVGPSPAAFHALAAAPGQLAWSVHAVDADLRKRLVPTAAFSPEALREGLIEALDAHRRPDAKDRAVMLAVGCCVDTVDLRDATSLLCGYSAEARMPRGYSVAVEWATLKEADRGDAVDVTQIFSGRRVDDAGRVAATPRLPRGYSVAVEWTTLGGGGSRRRRG